MIVWLALVSLAVGILTPLIANVVFLAAASFVVAGAIALLALIFGGSVSTILVIWLVTVVAIQTGFALSLFVLAAQRRARAHEEAKAVGIKSDLTHSR